jgi:hypothetical protein
MRTIFLAVLFLSASFSSVFCQTITSKSGGGLWDDVNTWVGGIIPGTNNDVIIDGAVTVNQTCNIRNLTINAGKIFQPYNYYGEYAVYVSGNITNNGVIRFNPNGNQFDFSVNGNVYNYGQWDSKLLAFAGTGIQYIAQGTGKFFNTTIRKRNFDNITAAGSKVTAQSDITLKGNFELNGIISSSWTNGTFDMGGYNLTLAASATVLYGTVLNASHLYITEDSRLQDVEFSGNMTLHGTGKIYNGEVYFNGNVTIADTLQPYPYYSPKVTFRGNIINNGIIREHVNGQTITIVAFGGIINNGIWRPAATYLPAKNNQVISQTAGKIFEGYFFGRDLDNISYSSGSLSAGSDLTFSSRFDLNGILNGTWTWGSINMAGYSLSLKGSGSIFNGTVKNSARLYMTEDSRLESVFFDGNVILNNNIRIYDNSVVFNGNITITDSLFPYPYYSPSLTVKGNVINNGVIKSHYLGQYIDIRVYGNIANNGIWQSRITFLPGTSDQILSQTAGKTFEGEFRKRDYDNSGNNTSLIIAGSDLSFKGVFYLNSIINNNWGNYGILDMKGKNLTLAGDANISSGTIRNAGSLYVIENSSLYDAVYEGDLTLRGRGRIYNGEVYFTGNVIIADTLQAFPYYSPKVTFKGNITNNGIIKYNPGGQFLDIVTYKNITNNGHWQPRITYLAGSADQIISQSDGKYFMGEFRKRGLDNTAYNNKIIAASSLVFKDNNAISLNGIIDGSWNNGIFDMGNNSLTIDGGYFLTEGRIRNINSLTTLNGAAVTNLTVEGDLNLKGEGLIYNNGVVFEGNVTVLDTLQAYPYYSPSPEFRKNLINFGIVKNHYKGQNLNPVISGSLFNYGKWLCGSTYLKAPDKNDSLIGEFSAYLNLGRAQGAASGDFYTAGPVTNTGTIEIQGNIKLFISKGDVFTNKGTIRGDGVIVNQGTFSSTHRVDYYDPVVSGLNIAVNIYDRKTMENLNITYYANQAHKYMTAAAKQWWRVAPKGEIGGFGLVLKYNPEMLNGNNENELEVYCSPDSGKTWKKISTPVNITRNLVDKTITIGSASYQLNQFGDIVIASGKPVELPRISLAVGGRRQIRVGPPNNYPITYWNNSSVPSDKFILKINTNRKVHILGITTKDMLTGKSVTVPIDSLNYLGQKDELLLLVQGLAPKEARSFDVILTAEPDMAKASTVKFEPITLTAAALWIGAALLEDYVGEAMQQGCYEIWAPVSASQSVKDAAVKAVKNSLVKPLTVENGVKSIAKSAAVEIIEKTGKVVFWPVDLTQNIYGCMQNTFKGIKDYMNGTHESAEKPLDKVTSWDPNAKEGPTGFGTNGYMASSAPVPYTIMFENKKEATAPAWKIVIVDTIDEKVFDVNSVNFGEMSHNIGVASRNGNVLTWTFTNIELPPNVNPPQGEGWVKFIVNLKPNLPTGTQIRNKAVITFDLNKPLETNTALNTLDFDAPKTTVASIANVPGSRNVKLTWNIDDYGGSGVSKSMIYMASNDGPFTLIKTTDSLEAVIPVVGNVNYKFYVLSEDNVGNLEVTPSKIWDILTDVKYEDIIPSEFSLSQNYPNPFNPVTTINYSVPVTSNVKITVYNILGQLISVLANEVKQPGNYRTQFNGSKLSSGVYFYSITAKNAEGKMNFSAVKKLLLLK